MTDRLAALELLADEDSPARAAALAHFHDAFCDQPLAMLKWLHVQVGGVAASVLQCLGWGAPSATWCMAPAQANASPPSLSAVSSGGVRP
jgi:hypothetical protein